MGEALLAASWHPLGAWSLGLRAALPISPAPIVDPSEGTADTRATLLGAEVAWAIGSDSWVFQPDLALGGGAALLRFDGSPTGRYVGTAVDIWTGLIHGRAGLAVRLARSWRLSADATLGASLPEAGVNFAKTPEAIWGRPFFLGSLALEFRTW
jgi:hypothetical protein